MPKSIDLDAVLKKQPQIDPEELKAARERRKQLRNTGPRQYQLVPPFGGRRVRRINPDLLPDRDRDRS